MNVSEIRHASRRWLLRNLLLPAGDLVFRQGLMEHLRFLEKAQWWNREALHGWRDRALRDLMRIAWHEVPFYRALMDNAGVTWRDFSGAADLRRVPVVTKQMLRPGYPHLTTRDTGQKRYETSSSGSTGANFYVMEDARTAGKYRAAFLLALEWAGWSIGERHCQTGMTLDRSGDRKLKDALLRCHYVSAFDLGNAHLDSTLDLLDTYHIRHLWGYPGSLYFLAARALARGWNRPFQSIVTWGDNLYPRYRATIEKAFHARVFDTYGCGEGIQIAAQCGEGAHYHIFTTEVIVEYMDDRGEPVPPGETGHVVLTRLHPGPMPLIRYRIGDLAVRPAYDSCACGRAMDLLDSVQGRDTDVVFTPSGNRLIVHFFTGVLEHFREVRFFQVLQREPDAIIVRVVPSHSWHRDAPSEIISRLRAAGIGNDLRIGIEQVPDIPVAPSGKRRFVICELPRKDRLMEVISGN